MAANKTAVKTAVAALRRAIKELSVDQVIEIAGIRRGFAVFPQARKELLIQSDPYFAQDCRDGACEKYWGRFGDRAAVPLIAGDMRWYDLPCDWQESLESMVDDDDEIGKHSNLIMEIFRAGLAVKAEELREELLANNLESAVLDALTGSAVEMHARTVFEHTTMSLLDMLAFKGEALNYGVPGSERAAFLEQAEMLNAFAGAAHLASLPMAGGEA